jgi:hypothetical protein
MQPPIADFYRQKIYQAANKAGQAASSARQFVSGAANAFTNPTSFASSGYPVARVNRFASSGSSGSGSGIPSDGEYKMFTRAELNDLYGNQKQKRGFSLMNTNFLSLGNGAIEHLIMMVQLYIALIAALGRLSMNAASMSASFLFGNETLINLFSIFLENALNLILNRRVGEMTLDDLHKSLKENQPKLQQMSALLINAISALAVGLSSVCSKIVEDWVENVLPGLLKSSAKGAASAAKAGLNVVTVGASDEILDILSSAVNIAGGMIKVLMGLERNVENFSEVFKKVKNAYDELKNLKDLFGKPPSEIAKAMRGIATTATAAVIPQAVKDFASKILDLKRNPYLNVSLGFGQNGEPSSPASPASASPASASPSELTPLSESSIHNLANKIKENFGTVKDIASKLGINVTGLSDLAEKIKTNSKLALFLAQRFGMTVTGLQAGMITRLADELENISGDPNNASVRGVKFVGKNMRPIADGLNNVSKRLNDASNFIYKKGGSGSKSRDKNKNKSMKYKNKKHLKRYMSNLRRKTAKKELDLLNGIRDFKSMIS